MFRVFAIVTLAVETLGGAIGVLMARVGWVTLGEAACEFTDPLNSARCGDARGSLVFGSGVFALAAVLAVLTAWSLGRRLPKITSFSGALGSFVGLPIAAMVLIGWWLSGIRVEF